MALNNLASLKAEMRDWAVDRPDLVSKFQDCIDMATNDLNRVLRTRRQQATVILTPDDTGTATLPPDYLEWRAVSSLITPNVALNPLTPEGMTEKYPTTYGGIPAHFMVQDDSIQVLPTNTAQIELIYYRKIPYLTETAPNDTHWLLQENPNLMLFGAMKYVEVYKRNMNGAQMFGGLYSGLIDGIIKETKRSQWSRVRARVSGRSTP
jgi:hypothetical protein